MSPLIDAIDKDISIVFLGNICSKSEFDLGFVFENKI